VENIKLKVKAISPIHIGSGEIYEPTNFVIDSNFLYYFRDEDFFEALNDDKQKRFLSLVSESKNDTFVKIHKFVKDNIETAKQVSILKIKTTDGIQKAYNQKIGKIVQLEKKGGSLSRVFNQFEIQRIQRMQYKSKNEEISFYPYIPGSSLKGSISTAYREFIYKNFGYQKMNELFEEKRNIKNHIFKYFKVADSIVKAQGSKIGYSVNRERFEDDDTGPHNLIEVMLKGSEFIVNISYDENKIDFDDIKTACNNHYKPILDSIIEDDSGDYIDVGYFFSDNYIKYLKELKLNKNQFLLRVGKHSGARAVTIDGMRDISIKESKHKTLHHQKEETTTWLFGDNSNSVENLQPFGWLLCEIIS
jgi:CRISPR-associated protein Csm5